MDEPNPHAQGSNLPHAVYVRRARVQASILNDSTCDELTELPPIRGAEGPEQMTILIQKIRQCGKVFDFSNLLGQIKSKEVKKAALTEIMEYIDRGSEAPFEEFMYEEIPQMVGKNIFRDFHPVDSHDFEMEEEEPTLEISWPHLQLVYELLMHFLDSPRFNVSTAKKYFSRRFIADVMKLLNSEDPRERDYLKTILHRMYGKFLHQRLFIRKEINYIFLSFTFENANFNGIGELLEILGSIINGFTIPLKREHIVFLDKVLLPLYSSRHLSHYHTQLCYCVCQFIIKDPTLGEMVISRILKYWPKTSSSKEIVYINEIYEIIVCFPLDQIDAVVVPIFRQICRSAFSSHFQVAEAALRFLKDEQNQMLISHFSKEVHPVILPMLHRISTEHWHVTIKTLVRLLTRQILGNNLSVIDEIQQAAENAGMAAREREERHNKVFRQLERLTLTEDDRSESRQDEEPCVNPLM